MKTSLLAFSISAALSTLVYASDGDSFIKAVKDRDGTKMMELLGSAPTLVNTKDPGNGDTALHIVTRRREYDYLSFLLGKGGNPNLENKAGETPLTLAAQLRWTDGAESLIGHRAQVDQPNRRGETPLILAVQNRDEPTVRMLLRAGANPKKTDNVGGYSAIDYAKKDPRGASIAKLLETPKTAPR